MDYPYCERCEIHHRPSPTVCLELRTLRELAAQQQGWQLALALDARCEWRANDCEHRATIRCRTYAGALEGVPIDDRLLCDEHALVSSLAANYPGYRFESELLPDPHKPRTLDRDGYVESPEEQSDLIGK